MQIGLDLLIEGAETEQLDSGAEEALITTTAAAIDTEEKNIVIVDSAEFVRNRRLQMNDIVLNNFTIIVTMEVTVNLVDYDTNNSTYVYYLLVNSLRDYVRQGNFSTDLISLSSSLNSTVFQAIRRVELSGVLAPVLIGPALSDDQQGTEDGSDPVGDEDVLSAGEIAGISIGAFFGLLLLLLLLLCCWKRERRNKIYAIGKTDGSDLEEQPAAHRSAKPSSAKKENEQPLELVEIYDGETDVEDDVMQATKELKACNPMQFENMTDKASLMQKQHSRVEQVPILPSISEEEQPQLPQMIRRDMTPRELSQFFSTPDVISLASSPQRSERHLNLNTSDADIVDMEEGSSASPRRKSSSSRNLSTESPPRPASVGGSRRASANDAHDAEVPVLDIPVLEEEVKEQKPPEPVLLKPTSFKRVDSVSQAVPDAQPLFDHQVTPRDVEETAAVVDSSELIDLEDAEAEAEAVVAAEVEADAEAEADVDTETSVSAAVAVADAEEKQPIDDDFTPAPIALTAAPVVKVVETPAAKPSVKVTKASAAPSPQASPLKTPSSVGKGTFFGFSSIRAGLSRRDFDLVMQASSRPATAMSWRADSTTQSFSPHRSPLASPGPSPKVPSLFLRGSSRKVAVDAIEDGHDGGDHVMTEEDWQLTDARSVKPQGTTPHSLQKVHSSDVSQSQMHLDAFIDSALLTSRGEHKDGGSEQPMSLTRLQSPDLLEAKFGGWDRSRGKRSDDSGASSPIETKQAPSEAYNSTASSSQLLASDAEHQMSGVFAPDTITPVDVFVREFKKNKSVVSLTSISGDESSVNRTDGGTLSKVSSFRLIKKSPSQYLDSAGGAGTNSHDNTNSVGSQAVDGEGLQEKLRVNYRGLLYHDPSQLKSWGETNAMQTDDASVYGDDASLISSLSPAASLAAAPPLRNDHLHAGLNLNMYRPWSAESEPDPLEELARAASHGMPRPHLSNGSIDEGESEEDDEEMQQRGPLSPSSGSNRFRRSALPPSFEASRTSYRRPAGADSERRPQPLLINVVASQASRSESLANHDSDLPDGSV